MPTCQRRQLFLQQDYGLFFKYTASVIELRSPNLITVLRFRPLQLLASI